MKKAIYASLAIGLVLVTAGIIYYRYSQYDISQQDYYAEKYAQAHSDYVKLRDAKTPDARQQNKAADELKNLDFQIWERWRMDAQELIYRFNQRHPWKKKPVPDQSHLRVN